MPVDPIHLQECAEDEIVLVWVGPVIEESKGVTAPGSGWMHGWMPDITISV